jgi:hypothetical protein
MKSSVVKETRPRRATMDQLRYVPAPTEDAEPDVLPFPQLGEQRQDWRRTIEAVENLMAKLEDDVSKLADEMEADILPFVSSDDDWPPPAA